MSTVSCSSTLSSSARREARERLLLVRTTGEPERSHWHQGPIYALVGAGEQEGHTPMHKSPCSLDLRAPGRDRQYYDIPAANAPKRMADTDQGDRPAHVASVRGTFQQPANCRPCLHRYLPAGQWLVDSSLACVRLLPDQREPGVPLCGPVADAQA